MWTYMYICRERNKERKVDRERERERIECDATNNSFESISLLG